MITVHIETNLPPADFHRAACTGVLNFKVCMGIQSYLSAVSEFDLLYFAYSSLELVLLHWPELIPGRR